MEYKDNKIPDEEECRLHHLGSRALVEGQSRELQGPRAAKEVFSCNDLWIVAVEGIPFVVRRYRLLAECPQQ